MEKQLILHLKDGRKIIYSNVLESWIDPINFRFIVLYEYHGQVNKCGSFSTYDILKINNREYYF